MSYNNRIKFRTLALFLMISFLIGTTNNYAETGKQAKPQGSDPALEKEAGQFLDEFYKAISKPINSNFKEEEYKKFFADNFVLSTEAGTGNLSPSAYSVADGSRGLTLFLLIRVMRESVRGMSETSAPDPKVFILRRNLQAFQNGDTVVATYDTFFYREAGGKKDVEKSQHEMSIFVRRNSKLVWMAHHINQLPKGSEIYGAPKGWYSAQASSTTAKIGIVTLDMNVKHGGESSVSLENDKNTPQALGGALRQTFQAKDYRGKRAQLTVYAKSDSVAVNGLIWMQADGGKTRVGAVNREGNIKGTNDWKPYTVTMDIPMDATYITVSAILDGPGKIWLDDFSIKVVGKDVALSDAETGAGNVEPMDLFRPNPVNLDFEE